MVFDTKWEIDRYFFNEQNHRYLFMLYQKYMELITEKFFWLMQVNWKSPQILNIIIFLVDLNLQIL